MRTLASRCEAQHYQRADAGSRQAEPGAKSRLPDSASSRIELPLFSKAHEQSRIQASRLHCGCDQVIQFETIVL
jgi:hypothetical protein